jgi:hypothetical protein
MSVVTEVVALMFCNNFSDLKSSCGSFNSPKSWIWLKLRFYFLQKWDEVGSLGVDNLTLPNKSWRMTTEATIDFFKKFYLVLFYCTPDVMATYSSRNVTTPVQHGEPATSSCGSGREKKHWLWKCACEREGRASACKPGASQCVSVDVFALFTE